MSTLSAQVIPRKNERIAARVVDGRALIIVLDQSHMHRLNEVGTRVFELCDGQLALHAIAAQIMLEFDVDAAVALADVQRFVQELSSVGALELSEAVGAPELSEAVAATAPGDAA